MSVVPLAVAPPEGGDLVAAASAPLLAAMGGLDAASRRALSVRLSRERRALLVFVVLDGHARDGWNAFREQVAIDDLRAQVRSACACFGLELEAVLAPLWAGEDGDPEAIRVALDAARSRVSGWIDTHRARFFAGAAERHHSASPYEPRVGYCRVVRVGDRVVVGGTAPIGPDGENVGGDAEAQARRCIEVIAAALERAGAGPEHVVRTRAYLVDATDWEAVGRAHAAFFGSHPPATTFVVVAGLLDPAWKVEIEAEAQLA